MDVKKALQFIVKTAPPIYLDDYKKICDRLSDHLELWVKDKERIAELKEQLAMYVGSEANEYGQSQQHIAELEAERDAAFNKGMERAAEIAEERGHLALPHVIREEIDT